MSNTCRTPFCQINTAGAFRILLCGWAILWLFLCPTATYAGSTVLSYRAGEHGNFTRFVIDVSEKPDYTLLTLENPDRLVVDIKGGSATMAAKRKTPERNTIVGKVRYGVQNGSDLRIVLDLSQPAAVTQHFIIPPNGQTNRSYRLVLDLAPKKTSFAGIPKQPETAQILPQADNAPATVVTAPLPLEKAPSPAVKSAPTRYIPTMALPWKELNTEKSATSPSPPEKNPAPVAIMQQPVTSVASAIRERQLMPQKPETPPSASGTLKLPATAPQEYIPTMARLTVAPKKAETPPPVAAKTARPEAIVPEIPAPEVAAIPVPAVKPLPAREKNPFQKAYKPLIVLDAGHGGQDPGATGKSGKREKYLTLDYAIALGKRIENLGKYRVILTRYDDTYIPLDGRVDIARRANADLFISLHADAHVNPEMRGLSIYTVSETASDREAESLASLANKSDILAGVDLDAQSDDVASILIDFAHRETSNNSAKFAEIMVAELKTDVKLLRNTHRFAGFRVLTAPSVPSVLVELGYLSNPDEERLLRTNTYKNKLVNAIIRSIDRYFQEQKAFDTASYDDETKP